MFLLLVLCLSPSVLPAQTTSAFDDQGLIRRAADSEAAELKTSDSVRFREQTQWDWGTEVRDVIECRDGRFDRIVEQRGQPLGEDRNRKEVRRLGDLLRNHNARSAAYRDWSAENRRRVKMVEAIPEAFLFKGPEYDPNGELRFEFSPDPRFRPHDRETKVFQGMRGTLWLDPVAERLTHVEGTLFKDVDFGWGILGRLYKGGHFEIEQRQVLPGVWELTRMDLDFRGRAFIFPTLKIFQRVTSSGFSPLQGDLGYEAAIALLLKDK